MNEYIVLWLFFCLLCQLLAAVLRQACGLPFPRTDRLYIAPAVIAGVVALAQIGVGIAQKAKAAKLARENKRPDLEDNPYTEQAAALTGSQAQRGLTTAAMQAYNTGADRALSSSINAILKSGGSSNNIADLYDGSQSGLRSLALADQQAKMQNISQFLTQGLKPKADQDRDQWYLNRYVPFKDTAALSAGLSDEGMNNIFKGINTGASAYIDYKQGGLYDQQKTYGRNLEDRRLSNKLDAHGSTSVSGVSGTYRSGLTPQVLGSKAPGVTPYPWRINTLTPAGKILNPVTGLYEDRQP